MSIPVYKPLTINGPATRARLLASLEWRNGHYWARKHGISPQTMARILQDADNPHVYPYQSDRLSKYQQILQMLKNDGLLVELSAEEQAA